jgi:hypothetical protein
MTIRFPSDRLVFRFPAPLRRSTRAALLAIATAVLAFGALPAEAQFSSNGSAVSAPRVFYDCSGNISCQMNHLRTEIQWVDWVNDRTLADVHVIVTSQMMANGGRHYVLDFTGRGKMAHLTDELTYTSSGTDVQRETLDAFTQTLRMGLLRFAMEAGMGSDFELAFAPRLNYQNGSGGEDGTGTGATGGEQRSAPHDPWNNWTFRVGLNGNMSIQQSRSSHRFSPGFGIDRVTDDWKVNLNANSNFFREKIQLTDRVVRNDRDMWNVNAIVVKSLGPNVSTGLDVGGGRSPQNNRHARVTTTPAIEWNFYPYAEASRRQLIAHYGAGLQYNSYMEETVFGVTQQTVPLHKIGVQYRAVEPWGNAGVSLDASQYLHDSGLYSYGASGNVSFRVARGLELSLNASGEQIADQLHIPAGNLSEEDILLGRVTLPTSYSYQASVGFNYRWGSSFSNVVNVRFPRSVR